MKPFDEQYTAWIDGTLTGRELAEFEAQLAQGLPNGLTKAQAEADRTAARQLGGLLRQHPSTAPAIKNPDFFSAQILRQIEAEQPRIARPTPSLLPFWRLIWGGLGSLGVAALLFAAFVAPTLHRVGPPPEYYAQILNSRTGDPTISAVSIHSKKEQVTVLWIDGLDYLPAKAKN